MDMQMNCLKFWKLPFLVCLLFSFSWVTSACTADDFLQCFSLHLEDSEAISKLLYLPNNFSYSSVLQFSMHNGRFNSSTLLKPLAIVTPTNVSHVQAAIHCSQKHNLHIRIRSGGHDLEGLSYVSSLPFVLVDLINLRTITVDATNKTAWVESGATLGELYYRIAEKSRTLAFPAGTWLTVGVGGHFSGGGFGSISRKHGLSVDNVIDAQLIDAKGRFLDRASMGEDLFWAIRGSGGQSFGVVVAWKISLVEVPTTVTIFFVSRTLEQNATKLIHRWQYIAPKFSEDLIINAYVSRVNSSQEGNKTIQVQFFCVFLGEADQLFLLMEETFPELGLLRDDCTEMSWIESVLFGGGFPSNASLDVMLDRTPVSAKNFKAKSDYVKEPIPEIAFEEIWEMFFEEDIEVPRLELNCYGGKMDEISESSTPFPHRAGNLFIVFSVVNWIEETEAASQRHLDWMRRLYSYMTPYVSENPREVYAGYRDLDLGMNNLCSPSYEEASIWGRKYFKNNFDKLVCVKTEADPTNFFRNEQSIPPLSWISKGDTY